MVAQFAAEINLRRGGRSVGAWGPIEEWGVNEESATFSVTITQGKVVARGSSPTVYKRKAGEWEVEASTENGEELRAGAAHAEGVADIHIAGDGNVRYPWPDEVELK